MNWGEDLVLAEEQHHIFRISKYPGWQKGPKLWRKQRSNQTNRSSPKKIGTRIYERVEKGGREPPGTWDIYIY